MKIMQSVVLPYIDCELRGITDTLKEPEKQRVEIYTNIWDSTFSPPKKNKKLDGLLISK